MNYAFSNPWSRIRRLSFKVLLQEESALVMVQLLKLLIRDQKVLQSGHEQNLFARCKEKVVCIHLSLI